MNTESDAIRFELDLDRADTIVHRYAKELGATYTVARSVNNGEHIAAVLNDECVFAAASSNISPDDALIVLAKRIREKTA